MTLRIQRLRRSVDERRGFGFRVGWMIGLLLLPASWGRAEEIRLQLSSPIPRQVIQREGFDPKNAHVHAIGGPKLGQGTVEIAGTIDAKTPATLEWRSVLIQGSQEAPWKPLDSRWNGSTFRAAVELAAGGWYRIEVRARREGGEAAVQAVEPVGVGDVFLISGQSYAAGANDKLFRIADPQGRVSALDLMTGRWQLADDPQPNVGDGGTIWPSMANALLPMVQVPIGLVNVAAGGTSSRQWLPGTPLYQRLAAAGKKIGRFRAVLWQQGESDVIERVATEKYVANLAAIRSSLVKEWGFEPPWLPAKSTLHPTVYNDPVGEERIRTAIDRLWRQPGFRPGPDTDILAGSNRGGPTTPRHFSAEGQENAGLLWFASVWQELNRSTSPEVHRQTADSIEKAVRTKENSRLP